MDLKKTIKMTRESILEQLKSSKFSEFAEGIENTSNYFKETGYDEQLFENALSVFTYHLDHKHEEIATAYEKIGNNFPLFFIVLKAHENASNWFTGGQVKGLSTFLTGFKEGKLDLSDYFMVSGFTFQIAAQSCKSILEFADKNEYPEECEALEIFYSVFDELWKIQMTAQGIISETKAWDNYITIYLFNKILNRADLESQSRMMAGVSSHENNPDIQNDIVDRYIESLDQQTSRLEGQIKQLAGVKETILEWFPS